MNFWTECAKEGVRSWWAHLSWWEGAIATAFALPAVLGYSGKMRHLFKNLEAYLPRYRRVLLSTLLLWLGWWILAEAKNRVVEAEVRAASAEARIGQDRLRDVESLRQANRDLRQDLKDLELEATGLRDRLGSLELTEKRALEAVQEQHRRDLDDARTGLSSVQRQLERTRELAAKWRHFAYESDSQVASVCVVPPFGARFGAFTITLSCECEIEDVELDAIGERQPGIFSRHVLPSEGPRSSTTISFELPGMTHNYILKARLISGTPIREFRYEFGAD